jgi:hypothetical protein
MGQERRGLEDARRELQVLKDKAVEAPAPATRSAQPAAPDAVRRMMEQRATLLRTGVYSPDDPVIRALDLEIQGAMAA